jgi:hypothetical protein
MPKYVIERDMPGAGKLTAQELQKASRRSADVMDDLGQIHWVQSYVTNDKIYCVYVAPDEQTVRKHAEKAGLPADRVSKVETIVDAATAD